MKQLVLIAHNIRSAHNVGSLLRTAEGLGVNQVFLTGYTPYPIAKNDPRLPHLARKVDQQIVKTALGAENFIKWQYQADLELVFSSLRQQNFTISALEQSTGSIELPAFKPPAKLALLVGRETEGVEPEVLARCDLILEIPMLGSKESFNVAVAAAIGLYHCRFSG